MVKLFKAPLEITFSLVGDDEIEMYKREFDALGESDNDPIGQWLKLSKGKGDTGDSDPILIHLLAEMHRKIDHLQNIIEDKLCKVISLKNIAGIDSVGYEHFTIHNNNLEQEKKYYGRITMPIFPKRDVAIFFTITKENIAKIELMHHRDNKDWDFYVASRERTLIREMRQSNVD